MDFSDWKEEMHMEQISGQLNNDLCTVGLLILTLKSTTDKSKHSVLVCYAMLLVISQLINFCASLLKTVL